MERPVVGERDRMKHVSSPTGSGEASGYVSLPAYIVAEVGLLCVERAIQAHGNAD